MSTLNEGFGYVEYVLDDLKKKSFCELSNLPTREEIPAPTQLTGLRFFIARKQGETGGIEINVTVSKRVFLFLSFMFQDGFEIFPDGRIESLQDPVPKDD